MNREGYRGNVLLVELIVVVLFFSLSAVISLGVFVQARTMTTEAEAVTRANEFMQQQAEMLAATSDAAACLTQNGFVSDGGSYTLAADGLTYDAAVTVNATTAGVRTTVLLTAQDAAGKALGSLTAGGYFPEVTTP